MRRKLFFVALVTIAIIAVADSFNLRLPFYDTAVLEGVEGEFLGEVKNIEDRGEKGFRLEVSLKGDKSGDVMISYYGKIERPWELLGSTIKFSASLESPQPRKNPRCFDYGKYLKSEGMDAVATLKNFEVVLQPNGIWQKAKIKLFQKKNLFLENLSEQGRGLAAGVLFGDISFLDEDVYENFRNNGTAHVLAVSGLHIGVLYGVIDKIMGKKQRKIKGAVIVLAMALMGTLASWSPSVTRASGMVLLKTYAVYTDKKYDSLSAMSLIMLSMIAINPYVLFSAGFQMSFLAAASIAFFMPHMSRKIPDSVAVMLSANLGLMPYQVFQFNFLSLTSFVANIPVVYLIGIFMPVAALDFGLFCAGVNFSLLREVTEALANGVLTVNQFTALGGKWAVDMTSPSLGFMLFLYMIMFFIASETFTIMVIRRQKLKIVMVTAIIGILSSVVGIATYDPVSDAHLVFVDVGQGDCVHLRVRDKDIMIDGGGSVNYEVGEKTLKPYLLKNGCKKLDLALATHPHTDHLKGLEELKEQGMAGEIRESVIAGSNFKLSENVFIETLWPIEIEDRQDANENCSVFMIHYNGYKILITGDLDEAGERKMLDFYGGTGKLKADILKVGHHGSPTSTCDEFLQETSPKYGVIQVGKNNYGHPNAKIIEKCSKNGTMLFRSDKNGAVGFYFNDGKIRYYKTITDN